MRPHKIRDYVERRDPDFERKMAAVLLHVDQGRGDQPWEAVARDATAAAGGDPFRR